MSKSAPALAVASVLSARAIKLARKSEQRRRGASLGSFVVVTVGPRRIGLPHSWLREMRRRPAISPVPNVPPWIAGVAVVRSDIVTVVDVRRLIGDADDTGGQALAVLSGDRGDLGLLVDAVLEFREITVDDVVAGVADPAARSGLPSLGTTHDLLMLLDVPRLLADPRIVVTRVVPDSERDAMESTRAERS